LVHVYMWRELVFKNSGSWWSPIRELATRANAWPQNTLVTEDNKRAQHRQQHKIVLANYISFSFSMELKSNIIKSIIMVK